MSSTRGGGARLQGRGSGTSSAAARATSRGRDGTSSPFSRTGGNATQSALAQHARGSSAATAARGRGQTPRGRNPFVRQAASARAGRLGGGIVAEGSSWQERYEQLKVHREREKKDAIAHGHMADPDKAISLSEAITLVGTCQDMCPEFERVQRVTRNEVSDEEKFNGDPKGAPDESRFVKTFKRSEAGADVQIPSDLRPPSSLKKVCDFLFNDIIANASSIGKVHRFVWDRTRAVRNDFSIQQISKLSDLEIAIDCFERIARFHIVALHELAIVDKPDDYDAQQDREQLDRTLLSLMQYYDDTRGRLRNPHEPEFRAYCIIFAITNPVPDLEDRVQTWARELLRDRRVQAALGIHAAACNTAFAQGPMQKSSHVIARQDWETFWDIVASKKVSFLAACVAEIFFNLIRELALKAIVRSARQGRLNRGDNSRESNTDWTFDDLNAVFNFDDKQELYDFVARWNLHFQTGDDGVKYLDIRHVGGTTLGDPSKIGPGQQKSSLVEDKRRGRTLPSIIAGLSVKQARDCGLVVDGEPEEEMANIYGDEEQGMGDADEDDDDGESLFMPQAKAEPASNTDALKSVDIFETLASENGLATKHEAPKAAAFSFKGQSLAPSPFHASTKPTNGFGLVSGTSPFATKPAANGPTAFNTTKSDGSSSDGEAAQGKSPFGAPSNRQNTSTGLFSKQAAASLSNAPATTMTSTSGLTTAGAPASTLFPSSGTTGAPGFSDCKPRTTSAPTFGAALANGEAPSTGIDNSRTSCPEKQTATWPLFDVNKTEESHGTQSSNGTSTAAVEQAFAAPQTNGGSTAPSTAMRPETNSKLSATMQQAPAPAQPASSAPPPAQNIQNASIPPGALSPGRRSSNWEENKPKKSSPLINSFTATEENASFTATQGAPPQTERFLDSSVNISQAGSKSVPAPTETTATPDEVLDKLANALTWDDSIGIYKQFVDFYVAQVIAEAKKKVYYDVAAEEWLKRSKHAVTVNACQLFRKAFHNKRLSSKGRALRERTRRRMQQSTSGSGANGAKMGNSTSSLVNSTVSSGEQSKGIRHGNVSDMLLQSVQRGRQTATDGSAQAGAKRSASAYSSDMAICTTSSVHKRQRSESQVEERKKSNKPTSINNPSDDLIRRSSFLGFSARDAPTRVSTTRSTYFRMKALGLHHAGYSVARGIKRQRSDSLDAASMPPPPSRAGSSGACASGWGPLRGTSPARSATSSRAKTDEEDEALFARLKKARESLRESESWIKEETAREELRQSLNSSTSSNESPSMARARAEARLRASTGASAANGQDVPAYRLRESRFVPREEYHLAEERARGMRASRASSRPASRTGDRADGLQNSSTEDLASALFGTSATPHQRESKLSALDPTSVTALSGLGAASKAPTIQTQTAAPLTARNPFSQTSSFALPSNGHNPFLQPSIAFTSQTNMMSAQSQQNDDFAQAKTSSFAAAPQNQMVQQSQVDSILTRTFAQPAPAVRSPSAHTNYGSPTPPATNSYMPSQDASEAISLLSDDEDEEQLKEGYDKQVLITKDPAEQDRTAFIGRSATVSFDQEAANRTLLDDASAYGNNAFAALADGIGDDGDMNVEPSNSDQNEREIPETLEQPESYQYSDDEEDGYDSDDEAVVDGQEYEHEPRAVSGYLDDEAEDGDTGNGYSYSDEESALDEEDRPEDWDSEADGHWDEVEESDADINHFPPLNHAYNHSILRAKGDPVLQAVGNTEEEAIELSD